jgi:signal transduction histidine kinase
VIRIIERFVKWFEDIFKLPTSGRFESEEGVSDECRSDDVSSSKNFSFPKKLQLTLRKGFLIPRRRRGLVLRGLICWAIGLLALHLDEVGSYDFRLSIRGAQNSSKDIVLIDLTQADLNTFLTPKDAIRALKEDVAISNDSRFWNLKLWRDILKRTLELKPTTVGINFFFDESIRPALTAKDWELFTDPRIVWMGAVSQGSLTQLPPFADQTKLNFGYGEIVRDEDGMVRSIPPYSPHYPSFALRLAERLRASARNDHPAGKAVINFRGPETSFQHILLPRLFSAELPAQSFTSKTIIIGASQDIYSGITSPVGHLSRSELVAHITDNLIHKRWVRRLPKAAAIGELFIVMLISVFLMTYFPQKVAFVFLTILSLALASFSIWFFDTFYIWTPAFSPLIQIMGTWMLFVGYLASRMEQKNWQLQQEKKSLAQLEQLKNNFVSLISHDLKTPIAKIQAIVDRLLLSEFSPELNQDLKSLRGSSQELHRYIQSILKILRVESKDFHLSIEVADINELVQSAVAQIRPLAQEKNITITESLEPLFSIEVDPTLIQEVLGNILENAVKYTPAAGKILVETHEVDQAIMVRIRDNGEGIRPEELDNVFGKFVRGKNQDLKTKGSGLGLYLVKYFIELHGGRVSLVSQIGKGTTIDLYLPTESYR